MAKCHGCVRPANGSDGLCAACRVDRGIVTGAIRTRGDTAPWRSDVQAEADAAIAAARDKLLALRAKKAQPAPKPRGEDAASTTAPETPAASPADSPRLAGELARRSSGAEPREESHTMARKTKSPRPTAGNQRWRCTKSEACSKSDRHRGRCDHKALLEQVAPARPVNDQGEYDPTPAEHQAHVDEVIADGRAAARQAGQIGEQARPLNMGLPTPEEVLRYLEFARLMGLPAPIAVCPYQERWTIYWPHQIVQVGEDGRPVEMELTAKA